MNYTNRFTILNVKNLTKENLKVERVVWFVKFKDANVEDFCNKIIENVPSVELNFTEGEVSEETEIVVHVILKINKVPKYFEKLTECIKSIVLLEGGTYLGYKFMLNPK